MPPIGGATERNHCTAKRSPLPGRKANVYPPGEGPRGSDPPTDRLLSRPRERLRAERIRGRGRAPAVPRYGQTPSERDRDAPSHPAALRGAGRGGAESRRVPLSPPPLPAGAGTQFLISYRSPPVPTRKRGRRARPGPGASPLDRGEPPPPPAAGGHVRPRRPGAIWLILPVTYACLKD